MTKHEKPEKEGRRQPGLSLGEARPTPVWGAGQIEEGGQQARLKGLLLRARRGCARRRRTCGTMCSTCLIRHCSANTLTALAGVLHTGL